MPNELLRISATATGSVRQYEGSREKKVKNNYLDYSFVDTTGHRLRVKPKW